MCLSLKKTADKALLEYVRDAFSEELYDRLAIEHVVRTA